MLIHECKPEFQFKKSSKNVKFGQCLYLVAHLCYEQNRCAEHGLKFDIVDDKKSNRMTKVEGSYATINAREFIWYTIYLKHGE